MEEGKCSEEDKVKSASRGESDAMDEKKEAQNGEHKNKVYTGYSTLYGLGME